jgi:hypothetical protein
VPLTALGEWALKLDLHRGLKERMPEAWIVRLADTRAKVNEWLYDKTAGLRPARVGGVKATSPGDGDA